MEEQTHASPQQQQTLVPEAEAAGPVRETQRIHALDLLRGVAILGIFIVNIQMFAMPFASAVMVHEFGGMSPADKAAWFFVKIFAEYKFISTFSLLFGAGLIMQMTRAQKAGAEFGWRYFRRIIILAVFGLIHALLFWYGDILFIYACIGTILFLFRDLRARTLLTIGGCLVVVAAVLTTSCVSVQWASMERQEQAQADVEAEEADGQDDVQVVEETLSDNDEPLRGWKAIAESQGQVISDTWITGETLAYSEGPFQDALAFRASSYAIALIAGVATFDWQILAMFLIGAGLMKANFFSPEKISMQRKLGLIGVAVGLPIEIIATWLNWTLGEEILGVQTIIASGIHVFGSVALCLGYTGIVCWIASSVRNAWLHYPIRAVGRMALTTYLGSTLIATFLMYWWGLGWFGSVSRSEQLLIVGCVYVVLILASMIWLRFFRFGPFEWLWRVLTYARWQPLLR